jgi:hypothetical protein
MLDDKFVKISTSRTFTNNISSIELPALTKSPLFLA